LLKQVRALESAQDRVNLVSILLRSLEADRIAANPRQLPQIPEV